MQLPACSGEIHEAELEGVQFVFLASPIAIAGDSDNRVCALRCARMSLGEPDASERPQAVPTGEEFEIDADQVILALGSSAEPWLAEAEPSLAVDGWARPIVDGDRTTSLQGVYAGGDLVRGASTVVEAIGDGLRAAEAIHLQLASD
jgi:glutamate synthase (NADPH/NADH) small chain